MKKDVLLLLADVFKNFISAYLKYYGLDPCHYFSAPGLSSDAILKMRKVESQKISDPDKYIFSDQWLKGGVGYIIKKYYKVNNE